MRKSWIAALVAAALLTGCGGAKPETLPAPASGTTEKPALTQPAPEQTPPKAAKQWKEPPQMKIDVNKKYFATMKTSMGDMKLELWPKEAPNAVNNFVFLAREGFYDGLTFHRIIKDFMIQGGDPVGNGTGTPGYRFAEELPVKHSYELGVLAMARTSQPNSQGSQFFICNGPGCKNLDQMPNYTQFGKVTEGLDTLAKLSSVEVVAAGEPSPSKPKVPPVIKSVTIEEK